jgi:hypothetical protein
MNLILLFLLPAISLASLTATYNLRIKGNTHLETKAFDSAAYFFSKVITDTTYADATDFLCLSCSLLEIKDTPGFKKNLIYSIQNGGADSNMVFIYFRPINASNQIFFKEYFRSIFPDYRQQFLTRIDTAVQQEMEDILYLDQLVHGGGYSKTNQPYMVEIGKLIDSINFKRVRALIEQDKYPGFHNFGIGSSKYSHILMHLGDETEERWNYMFSFVKKQALLGNITQKEVVAMATRHYAAKGKCTYYGSVRRGETKLCDCNNVDRFRAEIGLDNLKSEYTRLGIKIPECYKE